ncbi:MAG: YkgJ family cysteine cluster protein, partial [Deltaproteobacteria bacterium]|nr:YkgJ family cysteine cluster protein [Deltaproteobacteria bacterium]
MSDGKHPLPVMSYRVSLPAPPEVVQPEAMLSYACNQKGCCCRGWQIRLTLDDFIRLHERLPEPDRSELAQGLEMLVDTKDGKPAEIGDSKEAVLHALRLGTEGDDSHCRFVEGEGGCRVHAQQGLYALPDLCVNFPSAPFRAPGNEAVELWWDPVCPEVLRAIDGGDAPTKLLRTPPP